MDFSVFLSLLPLRNPGQRPGQQQVPWGTQTKTWSGLENTFLGDGCRFESRGVSETPQWFRRHWDSGRYRRGQVQISEILTGVTNPKENPYFLYRCTINCLSHIRSDCLLCLSLCPHSHLVVNTPAGLFLPPFFSPPPHQHTLQPHAFPSESTGKFTEAAAQTCQQWRPFISFLGYFISFRTWDLNTPHLRVWCIFVRSSSISVSH